MPRISHLAALRPVKPGDSPRQLRANQTDAERRLWYRLRANRLEGWKFRRQVPLGFYVVDFLCEDARLIVEVDGGQHNERACEDARRTEWMNARGYRVVRFWNNDVMQNIDGVLGAIISALNLGDRKP